MEIDSQVLGDFETNCYIVRSSPESTHCLLIDPGLAPETLISYLQQKQWRPDRILLTHGHCDHIAGIPALQEAFGELPVGLGEHEKFMVTDRTKNLSIMLGLNLELPPTADLYVDGQDVTYDGMTLQVLHTPGHTPGGVCYYCSAEQVAFTGDTLFADAVGRSDFPGGSHEQLIRSIREKLLVLPDTCKVLPGHGPTSTIGQEKQYNPFLK